MSKPVILLISCCVDIRTHDAIRKTWGANSSIPYKFFLGSFNPDYGIHNVSTHDDEVVVDAIDDRKSQTFKRRDTIRWAIREGYTNFFCAERDAYINTYRLLHSDFERADYIGWAGGPKFAGNAASGGSGYWLSERAGHIVANADITPTPNDPGIGQNEDDWVQKTLRQEGIVLTEDSRYSMGESYDFHEPPVLPTNENISCHLSRKTGQYNVAWMFEAYQQDIGYAPCAPLF
jgi:hypothetical protein